MEQEWSDSEAELTLEELEDLPNSNIASYSESIEDLEQGRQVVPLQAFPIAQQISNSTSTAIPRVLLNLSPSGTLLFDKSQFVELPIMLGKDIKCKIIRKRERFKEKLYPYYEMFVQDDANDSIEHFLLSARKRKKSKSSSYIISTQQSRSEKDAIVAKVRSNFVGTHFHIYGPRDTNEEFGQEFGTVIYEPNILGFNGPRKMTILLPGMTRDQQRISCRPTLESETLLGKFKQNNARDILCLHNKSPQWNEETQSFVLNFNGRVTLASVKNFQIVHDEDLDYITMQFGRIGDDQFTCDFKYPISPIQAFGIVLSRQTMVLPVLMQNWLVNN